MILKLSEYASDALRNYKPKVGYSNPRNTVIDIIVKKGFARYEAEAWFNAIWKLHNGNVQVVAKAIAELEK